MGRKGEPRPHVKAVLQVRGARLGRLKREHSAAGVIDLRQQGGKEGATFRGMGGRGGTLTKGRVDDP